MSRDSTVLPFRQPEAIDDPLSELAREGALPTSFCRAPKCMGTLTFSSGSPIPRFFRRLLEAV